MRSLLQLRRSCSSLPGRFPQVTARALVSNPKISHITDKGKSRRHASDIAYKARKHLHGIIYSDKSYYNSTVDPSVSLQGDLPESDRLQWLINQIQNESGRTHQIDSNIWKIYKGLTYRTKSTIPLAIHRQILRRVVPPHQIIRERINNIPTNLRKRFDEHEAKVYEFRIKTIISDMKKHQSCSTPVSPDCYKFAIQILSMVGHVDGCEGIWREAEGNEGWNPVHHEPFDRMRILAILRWLRQAKWASVRSRTTVDNRRYLATLLELLEIAKVRNHWDLDMLQPLLVVLCETSRMEIGLASIKRKVDDLVVDVLKHVYGIDLQTSSFFPDRKEKQNLSTGAMNALLGYLGQSRNVYSMTAMYDLLCSSTIVSDESAGMVSDRVPMEDEAEDELGETLEQATRREEVARGKGIFRRLMFREFESGAKPSQLTKSTTSQIESVADDFFTSISPIPETSNPIRRSPAFLPSVPSLLNSSPHLTISYPRGNPTPDKHTFDIMIQSICQTGDRRLALHSIRQADLYIQERNYLNIQKLHRKRDRVGVEFEIRLLNDLSGFETSWIAPFIRLQRSGKLLDTSTAFLEIMEDIHRHSGEYIQAIKQVLKDPKFVIPESQEAGIVDKIGDVESASDRYMRKLTDNHKELEEKLGQIRSRHEKLQIRVLASEAAKKAAEAEGAEVVVSKREKRDRRPWKELEPVDLQLA